jgi:ABC-type Fe3+ transport system substrate-binding protein
MRQFVYYFLIALVLVIPFALRRPADTAPAQSPAAQRLIIISPHIQDIRNEFAGAFSDWHQRTYNQPVDIDYRNVGGTNDIKRFLQATFGAQIGADGQFLPNATAGIDLAWGGGDYFFYHDLEPLKMLEDLPQDAAFVKLLHQAIPQSDLAGVHLLDVRADAHGKPLPPQWVGGCLSSFGIVYNADLCAALNLSPPQTWADLTNPRLRGYVALADPTHSASVAVTYMAILQKSMAVSEQAVFAEKPELKKLPKAQMVADPAYAAALDRGFKIGMGRLLLIAANSRYFTDSATQPPSDVANGQAATGTAIDFYGRVFEETVGPQRCRFVLPAAATAINADAIAILRGAPHPLLAEHFLEFLLSPEGQRLWDLRVGVPGGPKQRSLHRMPIRRDVYGHSPADRADWSDPSINPFDAAGDFNQRSEWMKPMSQLLQVWAAAWIDSNDDLSDAYTAVLAVGDQVRRQQLLDQLADLPITLPQVMDLMAQQSARLQTHQDADVFQAQQRIKLARQFAEHYREVKAQSRR